MTPEQEVARNKVLGIIRDASQTNDWVKYEPEIMECFEADRSFDATGFALGKLYQAKGNLSLAEIQLKQSLKLQNTGWYSDNLILFSQILAKQNRLEDSETSYEEVLSQNIHPKAREVVITELDNIRRRLIEKPDGGIKCQLRTEILAKPRTQFHDAAVNALKLVKRCERSLNPDFLSVLVSEPRYSPMDSSSDQLPSSLEPSKQSFVGLLNQVLLFVLKWCVISLALGGVVYLLINDGSFNVYCGEYKSCTVFLESFEYFGAGNSFLSCLLSSQPFILLLFIASLIPKLIYCLLFVWSLKYRIRDGLLEVKYGIMASSKERIIELRHAEDFLINKSLSQWLVRRSSLYILIKDAFGRPAHLVTVWGNVKTLRAIRDEMRGLAIALRACPFLRAGLVT